MQYITLEEVGFLNVEYDGPALDRFRKKLLMFAKERIDIIAERALEHFRSKMFEQRRAVSLQ